MTSSEILKLSLIDGSFSAEEAKEILLKIYHTKLNFHQRNNLSSQERFGKNNAIAELRIPILQKSIEEIKDFTKLAKNKNLSINISSQITLDLMKHD
ncbi:hypothetical protein [Halpernia frigidisoli]|uniref:Uncharacterized protein n=1 Tax=Halpernia frigidisoli TaxID=1125876 RepID=A0A1I3CZS5_9FLAO|nr:hypothetical protein [Halpernia frigidisoli]SFH79886.1 hypothetical protein SAMN05443292_0171 [Halpernia frigidisoli]